MSDWSQTTFRALGSHCRIVTPDPDLTAFGVAMVRSLEQRWSRFLPQSEICALNALNGSLVIVSSETFELITCAEQARTATNGAFNPLLLDHLEHAGYDRSWSQVVDTETALGASPPVCTEPIELIPQVQGVRLPAGARFDPGGIGKGLAGDLVASALRQRGATTAQVELGGDVCVAGPSWGGGEWRIHVGDADHGVDTAATVTLAEGGVATSSSVRRSWLRGDQRMHHLIDPSTGKPARTDLAAASIVAPSLWWAEVVAKVVVIAGSTEGRKLIRDLGMSGVLVQRDSDDRYEVVTAVEVAA